MRKAVRNCFLMRLFLYLLNTFKMKKNRFKNISLSENGVVLSFQSDEQKFFLYSEINKIYLIINKVSLIHVILFISFSIIILVFSLWVIDTDAALLFSILLIIYGIVRMKNYKRYGIKIGLKNGIFFENNVPLKLKYESIDIIYKIRNEIFKSQ